MDEQLSIRMGKDEADKLQKMAKRMGVSASEVIRLLIRSAELKPKQRTVYTVGATNLQQAVNQG